MEKNGARLRQNLEKKIGDTVKKNLITIRSDKGSETFSRKTQVSSSKNFNFSVLG
jgi:hypothetical protein